MNSSRKQNTLKMVQLSVLVAIILVLQLTGAAIPIGAITLTFVLIPIVVGAILLGPVYGAVLGGVFGIITVIQTPQNPILTFLFEENPIAYIAIAIVKAVAAGVVPGLIYKLFEKLFKGKKKYLATMLASVSAPLMNTGLFIIGMFMFFTKPISLMPAQFPEVFGKFGSPVQVLIIGMVGINFVGEFFTNLILSPAIVRIAEIIKKNK